MIIHFCQCVEGCFSEKEKAAQEWLLRGRRFGRISGPMNRCRFNEAPGGNPDDVRPMTLPSGAPGADDSVYMKEEQISAEIEDLTNLTKCH